MMDFTLACPVSERFPFTIKFELELKIGKLGLVDEESSEDWT